MQHAAPLARLIDALRALPGVGPKTAQRMAFHLLQGGRDGARTLATALTEGLSSIHRCKRCRIDAIQPAQVILANIVVLLDRQGGGECDGHCRGAQADGKQGGQQSFGHFTLLRRTAA